jgi:hypothetical protein
MAKDVGVDVMGYHTDNGIYTSKAKVENLVQSQQSIRHSRSGSKITKWSGRRSHRNGGVKSQDFDDPSSPLLAQRRRQNSLTSVS